MDIIGEDLEQRRIDTIANEVGLAIRGAASKPHAPQEFTIGMVQAVCAILIETAMPDHKACALRMAARVMNSVADLLQPVEIARNRLN